MWLYANRVDILNNIYIIIIFHSLGGVVFHGCIMIL